MLFFTQLVLLGSAYNATAKKGVITAENLRVVTVPTLLSSEFMSYWI